MSDDKSEKSRDEIVEEIAFRIKVRPTEDDFDIIDKVNRIIDGDLRTNSERESMEGESHREERLEKQMSVIEEKALKGKLKQRDNLPRTVKEAMMRPDWHLWKEAIRKEMMSIVKLGTFRDLQSKRDAYGRALGTKMVLTIKYNTDVSIEHYKARFVILGNRQVYGESYGETYAPVASMPSVRMFINFAAKKGLPMHQMDIMTAFLNAPMDYLVDVLLDTETLTVVKELARN